jgi:hypothetical protein
MPLPWRGRQHIPPKYVYLSTNLSVLLQVPYRAHPYPRLTTQQPKFGLGRLIVRVFRSHTPGRTPLEEGSSRIGGRYLRRNTTGFEPAITAIKRPQTYTLDRTATWIRFRFRYMHFMQVHYCTSIIWFIAFVTTTENRSRYEALS